MANTLQLKNDIKKLKTALASKSLSASIKNKLKGKLEKAEKDLKSTAPRKASSAKSAIASLKELVKKKKYSIYKKSGVDLKKDSEEPALPIGRRVSKGIKGNQYGNKKSSKGNVYYEYRPNRLDVKQPSKTAKYPKLADGGGIYSSDNLYILKVLKKGQKEVATEKFRAKSLLEANEIVKDEYVKKYESKFGNELSFLVIGAMAKGGMMAHGGKLSKKDFFKKYEENEDENMHSENVVLLAENYGTESDIRDAKTILAKHESIGHLPTSLRQERDALHDKLYAKYVQSREDGGMMADGGKVYSTDMKPHFSGTDRYIVKIDKDEKVFTSSKEFNDYTKKLDKEGYKKMAEGGVTEKEVVDSNAEMVLSNVKEVKHHADELSKVVTQKSNIEAWVVAKIERASTDLSDITHYLEGQHDKMSMGGSVYNHVHKMDKK